MKPFVVLTATYNHPENLKVLYKTLTQQDDLDFTWIVVNDGSKKETEDALDSFADSPFDHLYITQKNGGKSSAINNGLDHLTEEVKFLVIVDDDEELYPDAITTVKQYYEKYKDKNCGVIHFNRKNEKDEVIATPPIDQDMVMSYQRFKSERRWADGYVGYYTEKLGDTRFQIFKGERYIAPSTLYMTITKNCDLLWASAVLGKTEYLAGGITKQGRKLRVKNPNGMIVYCELMQQKDATLVNKLVYSMYGYAYAAFAKMKYTGKKLMPVAMLPGKLLAFYWKVKFKNLKK